MKKVNIYEKLETISEYWQPRILGEVNDTHIKLVKLKGELMIKFRDQNVILNEGKSFVIPKGVEHMPIADS